MFFFNLMVSRPLTRKGQKWHRRDLDTNKPLSFKNAKCFFWSVVRLWLSGRCILASDFYSHYLQYDQTAQEDVCGTAAVAFSQAEHFTL